MRSLLLHTAIARARSRWLPARDNILLSDPLRTDHRHGPQNGEYAVEEVRGMQEGNDPKWPLKIHATLKQ